MNTLLGMRLGNDVQRATPLQTLFETAARLVVADGITRAVDVLFVDVDGVAKILVIEPKGVRWSERPTALDFILLDAQGVPRIVRGVFARDVLQRIVTTVRGRLGMRSGA